MINIRTNVFETNSSSSHSITIPYPLEIEESVLPINDEGYIEVELHEFCHSPQDGQMARLAWLIQLIVNDKIGYNSFWYAHGNDEWEKLAEELYALEEFQELEAEIADYANCRGIRLVHGTEGYIDHESCYESMKAFLLEYGVYAVDFVFGKNIEMLFEFNG